MKRAIATVLLSLLLIVPAQITYAHVLVTDTTKTKGAVLHVSPDDDPAAGQSADFFLDMQDQDVANAVLAVINSEGVRTGVPLEINGSLATGSYVFPSQGIYKLIFKVTASSQDYSFEHTQRVSRGISNGAQEKQDHVWAEILLLASIVGLAVLAIVAVNRRTAIKLQSKW